MALIRATPPPGTMPSSTAARVADRASSTRCFFSFSSVSVAAPTRMMATPPDSLGQAFLQFFAVVIAGGLVDLDADLLDAALDFLLVAFAADDGGVVFVGGDFLSTAKVSNGGGLELAAGFFRNDHGAGQDGDILQHGLAAIAKARGFDGQHVEHAAQFVQNQGRQGFAIDVFGNDQQVALADLDQFFQQGNDIWQQRKFSCRRSGYRDRG